MVFTIKFSEMTSGGDIPNNSLTPGLASGANVLFNNPWTFLASGTTDDRPVPSIDIYYRLRLNTTLQVYEYYDPIDALWTELSGSGTGTINPGVTNNLSFYAANGTILSPLSNLANGVLTTNGSSVPALRTTFPVGLTLPSATITNSTATLTSGSVVSAPIAGIDLVNKTYADGLYTASVHSITGTTNQIIASSPVGDVTLSLPQDIAFGSSPKFNNITLTGGYVFDINNTIAFQLFAAVGSAVNYLRLGNSITGNPVTLSCEGTDSNIGISIGSKGDAGIGINTSAVSNAPFIIYNGTNSQHQTNFLFSNTAVARNVTFPDASGTVAFVSSSAQTFNGDSGSASPSSGVITFTGSTSGLTFTGSGSTMTLGGTLASANGGTGVNNGTKTITLGSPTTGYLLTSDSSGNATWKAPGYLTGAVLLSPSGDQNITNGNLILSVSNFIATTGNMIAGSNGFSGRLQSFPAGVNGGNLSIVAIGNSGNFQNILNNIATTAARTWSLPDVSGTIALTNQLPSASALTKTDDTNVTLTLAGSPTVALLAATSLTLGWTGQLGLTRGGSNASLTASNGGIIYSTASAMAVLAGTATAGQLLTSGASTAPAWTTSTYPATNAVNTLLYASSANVMAALATANDGVLITSNSGVPSWLANSGTPGYVLTANAGAPPSWQNIQADGAVTSLSGDSGSATPSTGVITLSGGSTGLVLTGSSHTVTLSGTLAIANGGTGINSFGTGISTALGQNVTGSGGIVLATSPSLTTPVLGAATATSINFGGSSLSNYAALQSWVPVFSFSTPGNLTVVYTNQNGYYSRIGNIIVANFFLVITPTYTTASGNLYITGLPIANNSATNNQALGTVLLQAPSWTTGTSPFLQLIPGSTILQVSVSGSSVNPSSITSLNFISGNTYAIVGSITYLA